jgi:hypothetical protein
MDDLEKTGININGIMASLFTALIHFIIEIIYLNLEAKACKTTLTQYAIVCFNGRFGWVPFTNNFSASNKDNSFIKVNEVLSFDDITSRLFGMDLSLKFEFCQATCENFIKALSTLPLEKSAENRLTISLGESLLPVNFTKVVDLLSISYQRVNLETKDLDITKMIYVD